MQEFETPKERREQLERICTIEIVDFDPTLEIKIANTESEYKVACILMPNGNASVVHLVDEYFDEDHNGQRYVVQVERNMDPDEALDVSKWLCMDWAGLDIAETELEDVVGFYSPDIETSALLFDDTDIPLPDEEQAIARDNALRRIDGASKSFKAVLLFD